ncbi:hypothetical protein SMKI_06G1160 [Saccharomyces mikatae IFO 1815]|uniref:UPF3 domain-containing protein n=1 Tax=Saccharomyces mikatae IFO 1815 TaxID=226126 RepID=A0AA35IYB6_SACMI|nr:uncharacterized protein SMKI_06G1160 [Saccharomyces mikatae IFO 1815]CAI4038768.1 hypothetical protein SMKI_06G1160 [Saccharomyces mikatae IFO 1815]
MSNVSEDLKNSEGKKKSRGGRYHNNKSRGKNKNETIDSKKNEGKNNNNNGTNNNNKGRRSNKKRNREHHNYKRKPRMGRSTENEGFKLVIRLLPPNLTANEFFTVLRDKNNDSDDKEDIQGKFKYSDWCFFEGHYSSKVFKNSTYSRCNLLFDNLPDLEKCATFIKTCKFIDNKENVTIPDLKLSPYVKKFTQTSKKDSALEGTIEEDEIFKTFMNSMKQLNKNDDYSFQDFSVLKSLEKEYSKSIELENKIAERTERVLTELVGNGDKVKNKNKKKKSKNAKKKFKDEEGTIKLPKKKRNRGKKKRNDRDKSSVTKTKNSNVVIIEEAGKEVLKQRKKKMLLQEKLKISKSSQPQLPSTQAQPSFQPKEKFLAPRVKILHRKDIKK